jgi:cytochrome c oxidase subunit 2
VPHYLLNVDKPLVVPVNTKIRFLFTAADVIHSWWVPDLGWKKDAVPGFINEAWTLVEKPGIYRGQCAELCGKDHGFMPIVVIAMEKADYEAWVVEQKSLAIAEASAAIREWSSDDLIAQGEKVYASSCASCHMADGAGISGTFPAITASSVVVGDLDAQVDLMMKGKGGMPAFGKSLSAVDFAAVSTFIRNGLGNSVGDSIQPSDIKALQSEVVPVEEEDDDDE